MRIELEVVPEHERSEHPCPCAVCGQRFVLGVVACWAYSDDGQADIGPTCGTCIEDGPARIEERLDEEARWSLLIAEQADALAAEGVSEAPTPTELRMMERLTR